MSITEAQFIQLLKMAIDAYIENMARPGYDHDRARAAAVLHCLSIKSDIPVWVGVDMASSEEAISTAG